MKYKSFNYTQRNVINKTYDTRVILKSPSIKYIGTQLAHPNMSKFMI